MSYSRHIPSPDPFPHRLFEQVATQCDDLDIIVQCGVGFGYGPCYMMEALTAANKRPHHYAFDLFDMPNAPGDAVEVDPLTPWGEPTAQWKTRTGGVGSRLDVFLFHIAQHPCRDRLTDWSQFPSFTVGDNFVDQSVAFVFLNASRSEQNVARELACWWRTVKAGGRLAVYGTDQPSVTRALAAFYNALDKTACVGGDAEGNTWVLTKENVNE